MSVRGHFRLGSTIVASFDTGAGTWPAGSGERADLFEQLAAAAPPDDWIFMTHRPLHNPPDGDGKDEEERALSGRERDWLVDRLLRLTPSPTVLCGHIHNSMEHTEDGVRSYVCGEGLGSRNLVSGREIARILMGSRVGKEPASYEWHPLDMPTSAYCHYKNAETLRLMGKAHPEGSFNANCPG